MASKTKVVVEISGDEQRVLDSFRKAEIADQKMRASMKMTADESKVAAKQLADDWSKGPQRATQSLNRMLASLKRSGPEGRAAARAIEKHLQDAGKHGRQSIDSIIDRIGNIDEAAAEAGRAMKMHFDKTSSDGKSAFTSLKTTAVAQLGSVVTAYVGVQEAVQFVNRLIADQQELLGDSADKLMEFARAKEQAQMNLSELDEPVRIELMNSFVRKVMERSSVADPGAIATAIGDSISAGASPTQARSAVMTGARLNPLNPDRLPTFSGAFVDLQRAMGIDDAELAANQGLLAMTQSRVVVPQKLFRNIAPVAATAADTAGAGKREVGALEGMALFAAFTKMATDPQGDASQTAAIQLTKRMEAFFENLGEDASEARSKLAALRKEDPLSNQQRLMFDRLTLQEGQQQASKARAEGLRSELSRIQDLQDSGAMKGEDARQLSIRKRKVKQALVDAERSVFTESEAAQLADLRSTIGEKDRDFKSRVAELEGAIAAENIKGFSGKVPTTPGEMQQAFQQNPELLKAFLKDKFGEQRFRAAISSFVKGEDAFELFSDARNLLFSNRGSKTKFEEQLRVARESDPTIREAVLQQQFLASEMAQKVFNEEGAGGGSFRRDLAKTLKETRSGGFDSFVQGIGEIGVGSGVLLGGSIGSEELLSGLQRATTRLKENRYAFGADGTITQDEQSKLTRLQSFIGLTLDRFSNPTIQQDPNLGSTLSRVRQGNQGVFSDPGQMFAVRENEDIFRRLEEILSRQLELQSQMLKSTQGTEKNTRRNGTAQQQAAAATNARAGQ